MSETAVVAREIEKQGEGMRILISETSMRLIQKVGGFRCESRGTLHVKVQSSHLNIQSVQRTQLYIVVSVSLLVSASLNIAGYLNWL